ncbi:MAG: hypothetical protein EBR10_04655 [Planctomycetes bacterium]|nr:hypothetical protein [Planctomycetota bacterium]
MVGVLKPQDSELQGAMQFAQETRMGNRIRPGQTREAAGGSCRRMRLLKHAAHLPSAQRMRLDP